MLYRRWQWEQDHFEGVFFYICSDASPQWNYEYLITKKSMARIDLPPDGCQDPLAHVEVTEHLLPIATHGHGRSKVEDKLMRIIRKFKLEVPTSKLQDFRLRVRSCYSDQAAEKGMWSAPNLTGADMDQMLKDLSCSTSASSQHDSASFFVVSCCLGASGVVAHLLQRSPGRIHVS